MSTTHHVQTTRLDTETRVQELTSHELDRVTGGAGTPLASVTDLVIDPFNANQATYNPNRGVFYLRNY